MQSPRRSEQLWLHETTQRVLVRLAIVAFGLLPLMATITFVAVSRTDWYRLRQAASWRERILSNTGLDAVFASIDMPAPNRFVITDLVFSDPETHTSILWADRVQGEMTSGGWAVSIGSAHIKPEKTDLALKILHDQFLCRPHNSVPILKLNVGELQMMLSPQSASEGAALTALQEILVEYSPSTESSEIKVRYSVANGAQQSPSLVHVVRNHDAVNPRTEWAIDTRDGALPCSVLSRYFPVLSHAGDLAQFTGQVRWSQDAQGWDCKIEQARFDDCSWERLSQSIGSPLQGRGRLLLANAKLRNGVLENVQGSFSSDEAQETVVDVAWLKESIGTFQWDADDLRKIETPLAKVSGLNLAFQLNHTGIQWIGQGPVIMHLQQPAYQELARVEGCRIVSRHHSHEISTNTATLGQWLARSSSGSFSSPSADGAGGLGADLLESSPVLQGWQAHLATLLPPPAPSNGPVGRVSVIPAN